MRARLASAVACKACCWERAALAWFKAAWNVRGSISKSVCPFDDLTFLVIFLDQVAGDLRTDRGIDFSLSSELIHS